LVFRGHKKEFLLKFARDRKRWLGLLFRAKQKYGLEVLNYIVTYNHIHLVGCLICIDMNMVRTGVVSHPSEWRRSGYKETPNPKKRYTILNYSWLMELLGFKYLDVLKEAHGQWIEER